MSEKCLVSPCVKQCKLSVDLICEGCGRSLEEIRCWRLMTAEQQGGVWLRLRGGTVLREESSCGGPRARVMLSKSSASISVFVGTIRLLACWFLATE